MADLFNTLYSISLILSLIALVLAMYVAVFRSYTLYILPRALRLYLIINCFPFMLYIISVSIYMAAFYLMFQTQQHISIDIMRYGVTFSSEQIRVTLWSLVIERIIATVYLERYTLSTSLKLFWFLITYSYISTILYVGFTVYCKQVPGMLYLFELNNYFILATHFFTIFICTILHLMNKRMYKLSVYRISLRKRYQIFENVKVLTFIFPSILIYTLLAHMGAIIVVISPITWPLSVYHIFYNITFSLMCIRHFFLHGRQSKIIPQNHVQVTTVANAFGKSLPVVVNADNYFRDLQSSWKK